MEKDKAKEIYEKVSGDLKLEFVSYYKYSFLFKGNKDNVVVKVNYGGNADNIYRFYVSALPFEAPKTFEELMNNYYSVNIKSPDGEFIDYHY